MVSRISPFRLELLKIAASVLLTLPSPALAKTKTPRGDGQHGGKHGASTKAGDDGGDEGDEGDEGSGARRGARARGDGGGKGWIALSDGVPRPEPSAAQRQDGLILFRRSLLERTYPDSHPRPEEVLTAIEFIVPAAFFGIADADEQASRD